LSDRTALPTQDPMWRIWLVLVLALGAAGCGDDRFFAQIPPEPQAPPADAQRLVTLAEREAPAREQRAALRRYLSGRRISGPTIAAVLRHTRDGITLRPGASGGARLGGRPVLPAGEPWPRSANGNPFTLIAVFDFAKLPHLVPLPRRGTLALYWNGHWVEEPGGGEMDFVAATRAYYVPPGGAVDHPEAPEESWPFAAIPLDGTVAPIAGDPGVVADEIKGRPDADALLEAMNDVMSAGLYPHHLLGAPIEVQGPVLAGMPSFFDPKFDYLAPASRERFTAAERESGDWMLLAQIGEDEGLVIADGGELYFVILRSDLEARRFDRVIGIMDSH
jgi:hypothetical protein